MWKLTIALLLTATGVSPALAQSTPYGSCPDRAEVYQTRYERSHQPKDLVCFQKAMEREMTDNKRFSCPKSSQYYHETYLRNTRSSDLVCFQQALERELQ